MAFVRDDRRPGAVTAAHLAVGLQIVLLVETTILGAVFSSFFDLFRNAWFWHLAPTFGGYVLAPAIAAVVLLLIPLCLVLYHGAYRPAGPDRRGGARVHPGGRVRRSRCAAQAGGIIVVLVAAFVALAVVTIAMLLRKVTSEWLARSVR